MPRMGLEPTIPVFERAKTVYALDCAVTVIGESPFQTTLINTKQVSLNGNSLDLYLECTWFEFQ
jgi:hypothetical protein